MLTKKRVNVVLFMLFVFTLFFNMGSIYANEDKSKLDVGVITSKTDYNSYEPIEFNIVVKNTTEKRINNVVLDIELPNAIELSKGNIHEKINTLEGGQEKGYILTGKITPIVIENDKVDTDEMVDSSDKINSGSKVDTGDYSQNETYIVLFIASSASLTLLYIIKRGQGKIKLRSFFIFFLVASMLSSTTIHASANNETNTNYFEEIKEIIINGEKALVKIKVSFEEPTGEVGVITLDQQLGEDGFYVTEEHELTFSGTAADSDGIKELNYIIDDNSGNIKRGKAKGTVQWSFQENFRTGTSNVSLELVDTSGEISTFNFKVAKLSNEIKLSDQTFVMSIEDINNFENAIYDSFFAGQDSNEIEDDGIFLILNENALFTQQLKSNQENPKEGQILYAQPSEKTPSGINVKIMDVIEPSNSTFSPLYQGTELPDEQYEVIFLQTPSYQELIEDDVLLIYDEVCTTDNKILYFLTPDGKNALDPNSNANNSKSRAQESSFNFLPKITYNKDGLEISYDNVLYDQDGDEDTEGDQIALKGDINLSNMSMKGIFEYKLQDILPKDLGIKANYDFDVNTKLTFGGEYNAEAFVEEINKLYQGKKRTDKLDSLNSFTVQGFQLSGVKMNKEIYLGTIGIQLGTGQSMVGTLGQIGKFSVAPVVTVSFVIDLEGKLKLQASYEYDYTSYNESALTFNLKDFKGVGGFFNKAAIIASQRWNELYELKVSNNVYASKVDKKHKPKVSHTYKWNGEAKISTGLGANVGIMFLNVIPASIGAGVGLEAQVKGDIDANFLNGDVTDNSKWEANGSLTTGLYGKYALRLMVNHKKTDFKFGVNFNDKFWIHHFLNKEFEFKNKRDVEFTVYDNTTDNNLIKNDKYTLTLYNDMDEYDYDLTTGIASFKDIKEGKYTVKVLDEKSNVIYSEGIDISKDHTSFTIYLNTINYNSPVFEQGNYTIHSITDTEAYATIVANEDSVVSYDDYDYSGWGVVYKKFIKKGEKLPFLEAIDLTIHEGSISMISSSENTNVEELYTVNKLDHEAVFGFIVHEGEKKFMDNQAYDGHIGSNDVRYYAHSPEKVVYKRITTDYWWNTHFGSEIGVEEIDFDKVADFWSGIGSCNKIEYSVFAGELHIAIPYKDKDKLVYS